MLNGLLKWTPIFTEGGLSAIGGGADWFLKFFLVTLAVAEPFHEERVVRNKLIKQARQYGENRKSK